MLHWLIRWLLAPLARALYRPKVTGLAGLPSHGAVIVAANHLSVVDTVVLSFVLPRKVRFLGKAEYFTGTGVRGRLFAAFLDALGFVGVDRSNASAGLAALDVAGRVLDADGVFAIYPEGTRSLDGRLHRGHTGVAQLALSRQAPVLPVALRGTDRVQPVGRRLPRIAPISVTFGAPLEFSRYAGLESSPAIRRAVTDEIMAAILDLSGQEYVDSYHQRPEAA